MTRIPTLSIFREAVINWDDFKPDKDILLPDQNEDAIDMLAERVEFEPEMIDTFYRISKESPLYGQLVAKCVERKMKKSLKI